MTCWGQSPSDRKEAPNTHTLSFLHLLRVLHLSGEEPVNHFLKLLDHKLIISEATGFLSPSSGKRVHRQDRMCCPGEAGSHAERVPQRGPLDLGTEMFVLRTEHPTCAQHFTEKEG